VCYVLCVVVELSWLICSGELRARASMVLRNHLRHSGPTAHRSSSGSRCWIFGES
jgi:hypothetical protein